MIFSDMTIRCIVACFDSNGKPEFFPCVVNVTDSEYNDGLHYRTAIELASEKGYDASLIGSVVFDENDGPDFLFDHFFPPSDNSPRGCHTV